MADDHPMVLERVLSLLLPNFEVVGTADDGSDLVTEALRLKPDVIVSDITMPMLTGIEAARQLREAGLSCKFVFLTVHAQSAVLDACFDKGALGYVVKPHMRTDLVPAIKEALSGRRFVSPSISR